MEKAVILLNPSSGGGKSLKKKAGIESVFKYHHLDYDLVVTSSEDHLRELARRACGQTKILVGVGGDTTFNIIASQVLIESQRSGSVPTLGFIGTGSANDICRSLGVQQTGKLCLAIRNHRTRKMDVGWVEAGESKQKHCFLGSMSLGLGVAVNRYLADFSYHHPRLSQWDFIGQGVAGAAGVFRAFKEKAVPCSLTLSHNGNKQVVSFSLLVFLNIDHYAGGLELNPGGSAFDGFIDCAVIDTSSTLSTVFFRHSVIKKKHMDRNEFTIFQSSRFGMESPDPVTIQLDGEVLGCGQRCEVGIFPRAIEVFTSL